MSISVMIVLNNKNLAGNVHNKEDRDLNQSTA